MSSNVSTNNNSTKPVQKLVSFTEKEMKLMEKELKGWKIVSLTSHGSRYVGIVEEMQPGQSDAVYIPPRKKLKIFM
jgi:hypothetical protein